MSISKNFCTPNTFVCSISRITICNPPLKHLFFFYLDLGRHPQKKFLAHKKKFFPFNRALGTYLIFFHAWTFSNSHSPLTILTDYHFQMPKFNTNFFIQSYITTWIPTSYKNKNLTLTEIYFKTSSVHTHQWPTILPNSPLIQPVV